MTTPPSTSLHTDPLKFSHQLHDQHGVLDYTFWAPSDPVRAVTDMTEHLPSNLAAIHDALARPRDDLPGMAAWRSYCQRTWTAIENGQEADVYPLLERFLGPAMDGKDDRELAQLTLVDLGNRLPAGQASLRPDRLGGLSPRLLGTRSWLRDALSRFLPQSPMICANEVYECKSSTGQLMKAVRVGDVRVDSLSSHASNPKGGAEQLSGSRQSSLLSLRWRLGDSSS